MAEFTEALEKVLKSEGGYVNDPDDPGGETNYGIAKRYHPDVDIAALTPDDAGEIYRTEYWESIAGDYSQLENQALANKMLDSAVSLGTRRANRMLQRAANAAMHSDHLEVDGWAGQITMTMVNGLQPVVLLGAIRAQIAQFRVQRVQRAPTQEKFIKGWLRRAYA